MSEFEAPIGREQLATAVIEHAPLEVQEIIDTLNVEGDVAQSPLMNETVTALGLAPSDLFLMAFCLGVQCQINRVAAENEAHSEA